MNTAESVREVRRVMNHGDCLCWWVGQRKGVTFHCPLCSQPCHPTGRWKPQVMGLQLSPVVVVLMLPWEPQSSWALTAWLLGGWHHLLQNTQVPGQILAQSKGHRKGISCVCGDVCSQDTCVLPAAEKSSCHPWKSTDTWASPEISSKSLPGAFSKGNERQVD